MRVVVDEAETRAGNTFHANDLSLYNLIRYHMGWADERFLPVTADPGKRVRPAICLLTASAAGGRPDAAIPVAAAIELLHNFTLLHDDVQDRSELRRGRPTVWHTWGEAQAINAGDATFALSQLALLVDGEYEIADDTLLEIVSEFNRMTLRIVEGQVLDLGFEMQSDISVEDYLRMIGGKTAAIVAFASWAGARVAGREPEICRRYYEFGRTLGLGFQIRDDFLGIWGDASSTGKQPGDDIRGRKQSVPIIMLKESASREQRDRLQNIYKQESISSKDVESVKKLLDEYGVAERVQQLTETYHREALSLLYDIAEQNESREALARLAERLVDRAR
jgi:geranylgeranyl diphosphate synthase, type I